MMDRKSFRGRATVKAATEGVAEIVVSAFGNVDHDGDLIVKGAVTKQLAGDYGPARPKGLLDHHFAMSSSVAKTLDWWEEDDGLHIEAQYNLDKEIGRDAFSDLKFYGADMEFSIGLQIRDTARPDKAQKALGAKQIVTEMGILEWSHVVLGANSETRLVSAKSLKLIEGETATKALAGSMEERSEALRDALHEAHPAAEWLWIKGTFDDHVIVQRDLSVDGDEMVSDTVSIDYTATDDGFEFGEPVEVVVSEVATPKTFATAEIAAPKRMDVVAAHFHFAEALGAFDTR